MSDSIPVRKIAQQRVPKADDRLLQFADEQIAHMQAYAKLDGVNGQPGFYELNQAMMQYQTVLLGLISLNAVAKVELAKAKEEFDDWFAQRYVETRDVLNPRSVASTKWYSTKEIEMEVRVRFRDEFRRLNDEVTFSEQKVALIRRILEGWQSHQFILARIAKNVETEFTGGRIMDDKITF